MQKLLIGRVVKPQGIKGEVKVLLLTDGFFSVKNLKEAYIGDKLYKINSIKDAGVPCAFLGLQGVTDRNAAEALRGADVYADKSLINKDKNAYFIEDLIGLTLYAGEDKIGAIQDVIKSNVDMFVISGVESAGGNDGENKAVEETENDDKTSDKKPQKNAEKQQKSGVIYMPFLKVLNSKIDLNAKTITVDKAKFYECATYEN